MSEVTDQIAAFVRERFHIAEGHPYFTYDVHLWEEGFLDSMGLVELLAFLEDRFQVQVPQDALFNEECTSINGFARLITSLRETSTTASSCGAGAETVTNNDLLPWRDAA